MPQKKIGICKFCCLGIICLMKRSTNEGHAQQQSVRCQACKYLAISNVYVDALFQTNAFGTVTKSVLSLYTFTEPQRLDSLRRTC